MLGAIGLIVIHGLAVILLAAIVGILLTAWAGEWLDRIHDDNDTDDVSKGSSR